MQLIESTLTKAEYLAALEQHFQSPFSFYAERFCGFAGKKYFYVIHHSEGQWDRRFKSPKTAAFGYVNDQENGCSVNFITFHGMLCPSQFLLSIFITVLSGFFILWFSNLLPYFLTLEFWGIQVLLILICAPLYTLFEAMTDRSEESYTVLISLLYDPQI